MPASIKIFLIGMPGSGKSTFAQLLAEKLDLPYLDLDLVIEIKHGKAIRDIFAESGEDEFRKIESQAFNSLVMSKEPYVMATGGGTPCFFDHLAKMNNAGITVYLDTPVDILVARTKQSKDRPLLNDNHQHKIEELFRQREIFYKKASFIVNTSGKTPEEIAAEIVALVK